MMDGCVGIVFWIGWRGRILCDAVDLYEGGKAELVRYGESMYGLKSGSLASG